MGQNIKGVISLLKSCGLPTEDVQDLDLNQFEIVEEDGKVLAVGALEVHAPYALLRSLAVDPKSRGKGLASEIVRRLEARAKAERLTKLFLLTTDASEYFRKHGFHLSDRSSAPQKIRTTSQFANLCPSSSILMEKDMI